MFASNVNLRPKQTVDSTRTGSRFGDVTSPEKSDHFKLLESDGDSLLVGARNAVYNLSLSDLTVHHTIEWKPPADVKEECHMKGKKMSECENYIRVLARQGNGKSLICGTHAFKPMCREYVYSAVDNKPKSTRQFDGQAISPYDPLDNSTAVYIPETNEIFSGTVSDFVGNDPLIYRKRISDKDNDGIRTQRDDARVLDSPNFVSSFTFKEHVYFFFRERAAEAMDNNEERQVYARVARVCRNDRGGPRPANEKWTSYVKARLNCSIPANTPFYFNELKAVSDPMPFGADHLVYGVFSTPETTVRMSAICTFSMNKIREEFQYGTFTHQRSSNSLWSPFSKIEIPKPRPGSCVPDSTKLPEATISFVLRNPLLFKAINSQGAPLIVEGAERPELTQIAVIPQIESVSGQKYDVIYVGTADGKVLKIIETGGKTALIESVIVFSRASPVVNLLTTTSHERMVVVSSDQVAALPLHNCEKQTSCSRCVSLQDPHCAWDLASARCVSKKNNWNGGSFVQNIVFGKSEQCPEGQYSDDYDVNGDSLPILAADVRGKAIYTTNHLVVACILCICLSGVIGALIGYRFSRTRTLAEQHHSSSSTSGSDYDSYGRARLTRHDSLTAASAKMEHIYGVAPHQKTSVDAMSMVMAIPPTMTLSQTASGVTTPSRDKNAIMTSLNQSTLPRDYKVKKVYL